MEDELIQTIRGILLDMCTALITDEGLQNHELGKLYIDAANDRIRATTDHYTKIRVLEGRIEELGGVRLEYGHYGAQTFIVHPAISVKDRFAALQSQLLELRKEAPHDGQ